MIAGIKIWLGKNNTQNIHIQLNRVSVTINGSSINHGLINVQNL